MKRHTRLLALSLLPLLPLAAETLRGTAVATFSGTSTLHDFTGTATSETFSVEWTPLPSGGGLFASTNLTFQVSGLSTAHQKRDRNMMKMFGAVQAVGGSLAAGTIAEGETPDLVVAIGPSLQTVPLRVSSLSESNGVIRFHADCDLSLKDGGLKPPSVVGLIRVGDQVKVAVDAVLERP
jgi:hypothetical protein